MNTLFKSFSISAVLLLCTTVVFAQKRSEETTAGDYSGPIIKKRDPSDGANLGNLFNVKMSQSFSASFTSFGGHAANTEAFTNSMQFFFSKKLTGQVDVSLLNSPFGSYNFNGFQQHNKLQVALDAQLDYEINKNMDIHLEVNRGPGGYGYGYYPGSYGSYLQGSPWGY